MIISIQDELHDISNNLKKFGYEIHKLSENYISDVYIYSENTMGLYSLSNAVNPGYNGALLINVENKSMEDIVFIIKNRIYSPLF